jgi:hypothetical protein
LDLRSWSFISRMRVFLWTTDGKNADRGDGREGTQVVGEARR